MLGRSQDYDRTSNIIERPQIMIIRGLVSIFFLLTVYPASATEIGRAVLDGREIILMEDQTWAYANPEAAGSSDDCVLSTKGGHNNWRSVFQPQLSCCCLCDAVVWVGANEK